MKASKLHGLALSVLLSTACGDSESTEPNARPAVEDPIALEFAVGPPTTDGLVARQNLTAQIEGLRSAVARGFVGPEVRDALVDALLTRAQFFGTWPDFDEALEVSAARLALPNAPAAGYLSRASVLAAVHRFDAAQAVLRSAPHDAETPRAMAGLEEATAGSSEALVAARRDAVSRRPTFENLVAYASAQAGLGQFEQADATYVRAAAEYGDVSPFPIAWIAFSRGVMWSEVAGRPDLGRPLYEEAVRRVPGYVSANVHLAELEADAGGVERASTRLTKLTRVALGDPEPHAVLGALNGDPLAIERARTGYEAMLARHPEAVWDHASEFFIDAGAAPQRAFELAAKNLELRKTERAYLLAIEAALVAGAGLEARELAARVAEPIHTVSLRELVHRVLS